MKLAVICRAVAGRENWKHNIVHTGQPYDPGLSDVFFKELEIPRPDHHLGVKVGPALMGRLKELRLPTVRQRYEETARGTERERLTYEHYLLEVITRECEQRRKVRVERLLRESELPREKSLPNFNVKRLPVKAERQLRMLLEGDFLNRKENVLVLDNPGSGKNHPLTALAQELILLRERRMHFTTCAKLMEGLLAAKWDFRLSREINGWRGLRV